MNKNYFFCDSQANIFATYFLMKKEFSSANNINILLVSDNSDKSVKCAKRIAKLDIFNEVNIINENGVEDIKICSLLDKYHLENANSVSVCSLENRTARVLFDYADKANARKIVLEEGVFLLDHFLKWREKNPNGFFANINLQYNGVEYWCFEPKLYNLSNGFDLYKLSVLEIIKDDENGYKTEIKKIFDVQDDRTYDIVYFDRYYSLERRIIPEIEVAILNKICNICSTYSFGIKKHPMERGFEMKFDGIDAGIMENEDAPWEAIYFTQYYNTSNKLICISGESIAMLSPAYIFNDNNFYIINLFKIIETYYKPPKSDIKDLLYVIDKIVNINEKRMFTPKDFDDFARVLSNIFGEKQTIQNWDLSSVLLGRYTKRLLDYESFVFNTTLQIINDNNQIETEIHKEIVRYGNQFELIYDISELNISNCAYIRWIPVGNCYIALRDAKCIFVESDIEEYVDLKSEQKITVDFEGYEENNYYLPTYRIDIGDNIPRNIIITGMWKFDFDKHRLIEQKIKEKDEHIKNITREYGAIQRKYIDTKSELDDIKKMLLVKVLLKIKKIIR